MPKIEFTEYIKHGSYIENIPIFALHDRFLTHNFHLLILSLNVVFAVLGFYSTSFSGL